MKMRLMIALFFMGITMTFAHNTEAFQYNEKQINDKFDALNQVESYVNSHEGITLSEMKAQNPTILQNMNISESTDGFAPHDNGRTMPIFGAFWWGCCLSIVGLVLTYFMTDNDNVQVKAAFWGCLISTLLFGIGGFWNPLGW